jgi:hypothetical protein
MHLVRFSFFESFRQILALKLAEIANIGYAKKIPPPRPKKFDVGIKNAKFDAVFDFVKKVAKNTCENVIKKMTEKKELLTFITVC